MRSKCGFWLFPSALSALTQPELPDDKAGRFGHRRDLEGIRKIGTRVFRQDARQNKDLEQRLDSTKTGSVQAAKPHAKGPDSALICEKDVNNARGHP